MKKQNKDRNLQAYRLFVLCALIAGVLMVLLVYSASIEPAFEIGSMKSHYENWGRFALLVYILIGVGLAAKQKATFAPFMDRFERQQLDERQLAVRLRVMDKTYKTLGILALLVIWIFSGQGIVFESEHWALAIATYLFLPQFIGAWQKDA